MDPTERLVAILIDVRERIARPGTDVVWSSWPDAISAVGEMDRVISQVRAGDCPSQKLELLFAPTGDIQEVAISNGWGDDYLRIAEEYGDAVVALGLRNR